MSYLRYGSIDTTPRTSTLIIIISIIHNSFLHSQPLLTTTNLFIIQNQLALAASFFSSQLIILVSGQHKNKDAEICYYLYNIQIILR